MLKVERLRAGYGGIEKLHGLSFELAEGRLTAIIGPNGCGKSTLLKCAAKLMEPMGGRILLDGRPLAEYDEKERARRVSYMPQSRLVPDTSVRHLVSHGRYPYLGWGRGLSREDREIIDEALARTGLSSCAQRGVRELSGGERQRAYLAMMLAQRAKLMLLDEPATYLDLSGQFELMKLLRELCGEGRGVAVVMHDLALALECADEVLLMRDGVLAARGAPEAVYESGAIGDVFRVRVRRAEDGKYLFYGDGEGFLRATRETGEKR